MGTRGRIISAALVGIFVFAGAAGYTVYQRLNPTVEATVTWVDPTERLAGIEFINPLDGHLVEMLGSMSNDCPIRSVDGQELTIEEVLPGTRIRVKGSWDKKAKLLRAKKIEVIKLADPRNWPEVLSEKQQDQETT